MSSDAKKPSYILQSVDSALDVLELLSNHNELGVSEVSTLLKIGKSTAYRLLHTLENKGYVSKDINSRYRLSIKFAYLGSIVLDRMEIIKHSHSYLEELTKSTNETTHLVIWTDDNNVRFIDKVTSSSTIRMDSFVGSKKPAYCTATGKVLLAYKDDDFLKKYLKEIDLIKFTSHTIENAEELKEVIHNIKLNGYSEDIDESEDGLTCFAAPIIDPTGNSLAAISVSGPTTRMLSNKPVLVKRLKNMAEKISESLA